MANTMQLLTTEANVKALAVLDDNLAGNYLRAAIMEAQEIDLRRIVGTSLLEALKSKAAAGTLDGPYKELVDNYVQFFLAYQTRAQLLPKVAYKAGNMGVIKTSDENVTPASSGEIVAEIARAQAKADYSAYRMQLWLLDNRAQLPELRECDCRQIHACLRSAATCGVWLGGPRGHGNGCDCE